MRPWVLRRGPFNGADSMKAEALGRFLEQGSNAHPDRHVLLVMDQARSDNAQDLAVPLNILLEFLPPYSPELNPVEFSGTNSWRNIVPTGFSIPLRPCAITWKRVSPGLNSIRLRHESLSVAMDQNWNYYDCNLE